MQVSSEGFMVIYRRYLKDTYMELDKAKEVLHVGRTGGL